MLAAIKDYTSRDIFYFSASFQNMLNGRQRSTLTYLLMSANCISYHVFLDLYNNYTILYVSQNHLT